MLRKKLLSKLDDYKAKMKARRLTGDGREILGGTPIAPPVGYVKSESLVERMRAMIRSEELAKAARESGFDTFEEADDFDVEDEEFPMSEYEFEETFDPKFEAPLSTPQPSEAKGGGEGAGSPEPPAPPPPAPANSAST